MAARGARARWYGARYGDRDAPANLVLYILAPGYL
jgi:hypothetical protein